MSATVSAACHVHSDWSYDGKWSLERLAAEFRRRGYRVLLMTEHDRGFTPARWSDYRQACRQASSPDLLVVPGIEYSEATNTVHILTWGDLPFLGENAPTRTTLEAVRQHGGVAVMAHPSRRNAWQCYDPAWASLLLGIEIWNRKTDGWRPSAKARQLIASAGVVAFAGMDFHDQKQMFPLGMTLELDGAPTEASVLACLQSRRCQPTVRGLPLNRATVNATLAALSPFELARRAGRWTYRKVRGPRQTVAPKPNGA